MSDNALQAFRYANEISHANPRQLDKIVEMFLRVAEIARRIPDSTIDEDGTAYDIEYYSYREIARAKRKMNEVGSGYQFDMKNFEAAAAYYRQAYALAPNAAEKISSLEGEASCFWNLGNKQKWADIKEEQLPYLDEKSRQYAETQIECELKNRAC